MSVWDDIWGACESAWDTVFGSIEAAIGSVADWVEGAFDTIESMISTLTPDALEDMLTSEFGGVIDALESMALAFPMMAREIEALIHDINERGAALLEDVEDATRWAVDQLEHVAEGAVKIAGTVLGAGLAVLDAGADLAGNALNTVIEEGFGLVEGAWNATIGPAVDSALEFLEEGGVFDAIDDLSLGLLDVSYDGSDLYADLGVPGLLAVGFDVGAEGVSGYGEVFGFGGLDTGITDDGGFHLSADVGLPLLWHVGYDVSLDESGNIGLGAEGWLNIPLPTGGYTTLAGGMDYQSTDEGFALDGEVGAGYTSATGQYVEGGYLASTTKDGDGSVTEVGTYEEVGQVGVGGVRTEETVTFHSHHGELTGTEGTITIDGSGVLDGLHEEVTIWDTQGGGRQVPGTGGPRGDDAGAGGGRRGPDSIADDITVRPRMRKAIEATSERAADLDLLDTQQYHAPANALAESEADVLGGVEAVSDVADFKVELPEELEDAGQFSSTDLDAPDTPDADVDQLADRTGGRHQHAVDHQRATDDLDLSFDLDL